MKINLSKEETNDLIASLGVNIQKQLSDDIKPKKEGVEWVKEYARKKSLYKRLLRLRDEHER